ncbi:uncharacterized protein [Eleutherodactylus coqui]|uniref:uncharacterized protein n=1 Tax=Eleutherodactylus coqui TaxID=57060 RepID=UPI0034623A9E
MRRLLFIFFYYLDEAASVQQSDSLLDLNITQRPHDSYLVFCTPQIHEEQITQVHWKEKHANGTYSVIAVLNPHLGNYTKYHETVKLHKKDEKTYMMEIITQEMCVCCEVVTFPSGSIHENCMTIEGEYVAYAFRYAILGTLLGGGFFVIGSFAVLCHICWMRKSSRVFMSRGRRQQSWTISQRSRVPYRRTLPSINISYEPPHDTDLRDNPSPTRAHLQHPHPTIHPPSGDLPPRNPTLTSYCPPENLLKISPTPPSLPPPRNHAVREAIPKPQPIYSNIHIRHKQYPKVRNVKSLQVEPTINQHPPEMFSHEGMDTTSTIPHYHTKSCLWLFEGTSYSSEDIASPHPSRLNCPSTPESPFTAINPMYHIGRAGIPIPTTAT